MKQRLLSMLCLLLGVAAGALAQHWSVNPHAFQYDMTAYVQLSKVQQSGYEVAAFCGDECRGIGKLLTANDGTQVFQLRIRSNEVTGETITFRAWNVADEQEYVANVSIAFASQTVEGTPSEPVVLDLGVSLKGDVNGDGEITAQDASLIQQYAARKFGADAEGFNAAAADVNGDGDVNAQDASLVQQYVAKKISW